MKVYSDLIRKKPNILDPLVMLKDKHNKKALSMFHSGTMSTRESKYNRGRSVSSINGPNARHFNQDGTVRTNHYPHLNISVNNGSLDREKIVKLRHRINKSNLGVPKQRFTNDSECGGLQETTGQTQAYDSTCAISREGSIDISAADITAHSYFYTTTHNHQDKAGFLYRRSWAKDQMGSQSSSHQL